MRMPHPSLLKGWIPWSSPSRALPTLRHPPFSQNTRKRVGHPRFRSSPTSSLYSSPRNVNPMASRESPPAAGFRPCLCALLGSVRQCRWPHRDSLPQSGSSLRVAPASPRTDRPSRGGFRRAPARWLRSTPTAAGSRPDTVSWSEARAPVEWILHNNPAVRLRSRPARRPRSATCTSFFASISRSSGVGPNRHSNNKNPNLIRASTVPPLVVEMFTRIRQRTLVASAT
jgi:hypothetical protein